MPLINIAHAPNKSFKMVKLQYLKSEGLFPVTDMNESKPDHLTMADKGEAIFYTLMENLTIEIILIKTKN